MTTTTSQADRLRALEKRLAVASGADDEELAEIETAVIKALLGWYTIEMFGQTFWRDPTTPYHSPKHMRVARSIDAVVTLCERCLGRDAFWRVGHTGDNHPGLFYSSIMPPNGLFEAFARTPPLAICLALVRALIARADHD